MKKHFTLTTLLTVYTFLLTAQPVDKAARDAFLVSRMAVKFHVQPRPVDKALSAAWFDNIIKQLDEAKVFFTQEDMLQLQPYRLHMDNELTGKKTAFLQLLIPVYRQRLKAADSMIDDICKKPFRFDINEKLMSSEIDAYPSNTSAQKLKWYKLLKGTILVAMLEEAYDPMRLQPAIQKEWTDSLEIVLRKKVNAYYKRIIKKTLEAPGGPEQVVCTAYCQSLATCYDPHSQYLPPSEKENFESDLGNAPMQFGFQLTENKNGDMVINNLKPGSPAFKSGQLNKGDIIQAVQWEGKEAIDLSGADREELHEIMSASNHEKLVFTVRKADGTKTSVSLLKEKMEQEEDENRVKGFLLKGEKRLGYISLPAFYTDWESEGRAMKGCSDDIAKELIKMKKENIEGLIVDIRYNGGGSMEEAVELAGIFIDAGPVAQTKSREEKVYTAKDVNRGTIYDGPLLVMVNGYSASASEVLAGTLQDYNRAYIVGSPTYGKATGQVILPLDTTIELTVDFLNRQVDSYLKLTMEKLYRVTGRSAQGTGVKPDIILPDLLEADPHREVDEPFALAATDVAPNKYYKPNAALPIASLKAFAKAYTDSSRYFKAMQSYIESHKQKQLVKDMPLSWTEASARQQQHQQSQLSPPEFRTSNTLFSVANYTSEKLRLQTDSDLRELNEAWKTRLVNDPYIDMAVLLLFFSINNTSIQ